MEPQTLRFVIRRLELLEFHQGREQIANLIGPIRQPIDVLGQGRPLAGAKPGDEFLGHEIKQVTILG